MRIFAPRHESTRGVPEDDIRHTSLDRVAVFRTPSGEFRTLRRGDKIVETSLSKKKVRDNLTQADKTSTVQDTPTESPALDEEPFEVEDRARRILALLLRTESRQVLELILDHPAAQRQRLGALLLTSHDVLYTFARLVAEGGMTTSEGRLMTTPLTDRIAAAISESPHPKP